MTKLALPVLPVSEEEVPSAVLPQPELVNMQPSLDAHAVLAVHSLQQLNATGAPVVSDPSPSTPQPSRRRMPRLAAAAAPTAHRPGGWQTFINRLPPLNQKVMVCGLKGKHRRQAYQAGRSAPTCRTCSPQPPGSSTPSPPTAREKEGTHDLLLGHVEHHVQRLRQGSLHINKQEWLVT